MDIIYAILIVPFLIKLLLIFQLVRYIRFINVHLTDLVFYYRDSHYDKKSNNYIPKSLEEIRWELHELYKVINERDYLSVDIIKNDKRRIY